MQFRYYSETRNTKIWIFILVYFYLIIFVLEQLFWRILKTNLSCLKNYFLITLVITEFFLNRCDQIVENIFPEKLRYRSLKSCFIFKNLVRIFVAGNVQVG